MTVVAASVSPPLAGAVPILPSSGPTTFLSDSPGRTFPEEVRAQRAAFEVSTAQAELNLAIQHRANDVNLVGSIKEQLDASYAGVWFDNQVGEFVVPVASGHEAQSVIRNRKEGVAQEFSAAALEGNFRIEAVEFNRAELVAGQEELNRRLASLPEKQRLRTALDPSTNAVQVLVPESIDLQTLAKIRGLIRGTGITIEIVERPAEAFDVGAAGGCSDQYRSCDLPFRGGQQIWSSVTPDPYSEVTSTCTAAFPVIGNDGRKYIVTAGHCVKDAYSEAISWSWFASTPTLGRKSIGTTNQWHWPGKDWAKIDAVGTFWDVPSWQTILGLWGWGVHDYAIVGEARSYVGQTVCHTGANTGTSCGQVIDENVYAEYDWNGKEKVNSMFEVTGPQLCVGEGDSGGPFYANNIALGILSGGVPDGCPGPTWVLYSDIVAANAELDVHLAGPSASDPKPTTETKPATDVKEVQVTLNGTVNPNGSATNYQFEYGTTTTYGESVPVPSGSAGGGTSAVSVSATAERLEPGTTYHYRLVASNSGGTSYGADQTFHTPGWRFMRGLSSGSGVSSWNTAIGMDLPPMAVGDVNADGKADIISVEKDNGLYRYKFGYSDGSGIPKWDQVLTGMGRPTRLAVGDLTGDGRADVVAVEPEGNGKYRYMLGYGAGAGISNWNQVMGGMSYPHKIALGDLTGDGKSDIVAVESQSNGQYRFMLGTSNGAGIGSWSQILSNMAYAEFLDLGDFTGDGKADVVSVENQGGGQFRFMLGTSNGAGIGSWSQVMGNMAGPYFFIAGDFTGDGKADVVSVESDGAGKYRYMLGASNGAGIGSWSQVLGGMGLPVRSDLGDLTGDGKADIVSVETESTGSYNYRLGISSGSSVSSWNQLVSWMRTPQKTAVGDVNADGKADIVSVESEGGGKYRYKFGFSGAFGIVSSWKTVLTGMGTTNALAVRDLTGDGRADVVAVEPEGNGKYRYMLGQSSGTGVSSWSSILSGMGLPTRMSLGDFNADGKADIIAFEPDGSGKYRIMRGLSNGVGISSWSQILGGLSYPQKAAVGDLTGDGKADIVSVESQGNGKYRYMLGKSSGSGISSWTQVMSEMAYAEFLDLGDFTGDGKADVVSVENQGGGQFRFMLGTSNGAGIANWSQLMGNMAGPYFFHLGDLDADGKADIVSVETM